MKIMFGLLTAGASAAFAVNPLSADAAIRMVSVSFVFKLV
jgi:hypothetical protein